ncbi:MAG: hypothetical protein KKE12_04105, partial [Proteobacteria bacterium]|nr:hypothetical protein [Pseudomonadota bacterium]
VVMIIGITLVMIMIVAVIMIVVVGMIVAVIVMVCHNIILHSNFCRHTGPGVYRHTGCQWLKTIF